MQDEALSESSFSTSRQRLSESNAEAVRTAQRLSDILELEWELQQEREAIYSQTVGQAWEAVMEALRTIAEKRGWNHDNNHLLKDALWFLGKESHNDRLSLLFSVVERNHVNYFEDHLDGYDIGRTLEAARELVDLLENL